MYIHAGLDPSGFRVSTAGEGDGDREGERQGRERYSDCKLPTTVCPACSKLVAVAGATVSGGPP